MERVFVQILDYIYILYYRTHLSTSIFVIVCEGDERVRICKAIPCIHKSKEASGSCQAPIHCVRTIDIVFKPRIHDHDPTAF